MNAEHLEMLASDGWRTTLRDAVFPFAFGDGVPHDLGDDVLEVGPGPGLTTDLLLEHLDQVTAIELDRELADALASRAGGRLTVVHGDASDMPFEARRFTGVASFTMLHHVPGTDIQDRLFAEVHRVLRPGGTFVASDGVGHPDLAALHEDDVYNPVDPGDLPERLRRAGFDEVDVRVLADRMWAVRATKAG